MVNTVSLIFFVTDGCACVVVNGDLVAQGSQFSLKDVEIVTAQIDLDAVYSHEFLLFVVFQCINLYVGDIAVDYGH